MARVVAVFALLALAAACTVRADARADYVEKMNAICRSAKERLAAIPPPVDPATKRIDVERVRRINARLAAAANRTEAELRDVEPPKKLARPHATLLQAIGQMREASVRLREQ
jgi:hypothetical protein